MHKIIEFFLDLFFEDLLTKIPIVNKISNILAAIFIGSFIIFVLIVYLR